MMKTSLKQTLLARANLAYRNKDYTGAIALYEQALGAASEVLKPHIRYNLDLVCRRLGLHIAAGGTKLEKPDDLDDYWFDLIRKSGYFDPAWYLAEYKDQYSISGNPLAHYLANGVSLSTNPSPNFDTAYYIKTHKDVKASGIHPFLHYVCQGHKEQRSTKPVDSEVDLGQYPVEPPEYVPRLPLDAGPFEKAARVIAFYLPQFHPIPENDAWWGKGFTEWTNVKPAQPQFEGHYQPHVPDEFLGYYDLRNTSVMRKQIELAKQYGIEGFCFYTYWFSGHRLLETPVDNYLRDRILDLPFCICWANENWSRRWDGLDHDLLMEQRYSPEDDLAFIAHMSKYLRDPRYIRIDDKPLLVVYRPNLFPAMQDTALRWRDWCQNNGMGEIYIAYVQSFENRDTADYGLDAAIEFPPNNSAPPNITDKALGLSAKFSGEIYDWRIFLGRSKNYEVPPYPLFRSTCPSWDNTARKKERGTVFVHSSPKLFERWLVGAIEDTRNRIPTLDQRLVFVNAWNEWAEGAHLEPDQRYGYAWLQAVRDAHQIALKKSARVVVVSHDAHPHGAQRICLNIVRYFKEQFHYEVDLILLGEGGLISEFQKYANVHEVNIALDDKSELNQLLKSFRNNGAVAAIVNTTVSGPIVPPLKENGFTVVSLIHEMPGILSSYNLCESAAQIAAHADKIVFPDKLVQDGFESFVGFPLKQAIIRPQGLYLPSLLRTEADKENLREQVRRRLGLPVNANIIVGSGYADYRKGFDLFVLACIKVMQQVPETYAVWVGHLDQEFVDKSLKTAVDVSLHERFLCIGLVDHPQPYYVAADVFALSSREDPFPSVVLEALDARTPVVAFKDCGGFDSILKRNCGILVDAVDHNAMANAIIYLLINEETARTLAATGQGIVEAEFSFHHYLFDLLDFACQPVPRVSVIVPNYNYDRYIRQRLESIVHQSHPIFELIVLDDCSTDQSLQVINAFFKECKPPHRLVINEQNSGSVFSQWHRGVELARGDMVWIAEADDLAAPEFLEKLLPFFQMPEVALAYSQSSQIDENNTLLANDYLAYTDDVGDYWRQDYVIDGVEEIKRALCVKNTIPNVSGVVFSRRQLLHAFQAAKEDMMNLKVAGDWVLYLHLANSGKVAFHTGSLNIHRRHVNSVTKVNSHLDEVIAVQQLALTLVPTAFGQLYRMIDYIEKLRKHFGRIS